jgi:hypothetical protein
MILNASDKARLCDLDCYSQHFPLPMFRVSPCEGSMLMQATDSRLTLPDLHGVHIPPPAYRASRALAL